MNTGLHFILHLSSNISPNPYINRVMIRNAQDFYGRKQEIARLYTRIGAERPQSVAITGERRVGKSSLLWFLMQPENVTRYLPNPERAIFVLPDLQENREMTVEEFCAALLAPLKERMPDISSDGGYDALLNAAQQLDAEGLKLIVLLDEFESVTQNPNFDERFYSFLRSLANRYNVAYVTSSRRPLQQFCYSREISDSPFFNIFSSLHLRGFTEAEARELISAPSEAAGVPLEPYADFLLDVGGRHPFFLQIACSALFEYLQIGDELDYLGLAKVEARIMEEARPHFLYIWENMSDAERRVVRVIVEDKPTGQRERIALRGLIQQGYVIEDESESVDYEEQEAKLFSYSFIQFAQHIIAETQEQIISELEEKVRERTKELSEKNEELEQALRRLQEAQSQLIMREKMASLGNLVAGVAHEMNNPIGVIHSAADVVNRGIHRIRNLIQGDQNLGRSDPNRKQLEQYFKLLEANHEAITTANNRMAKITQSLRVFAKLDEALLQKVDLHENIDTTLTLLYHELRDKATVVKEYGDVPQILCYPSELNQMLMNLLRNAIQAIEQRGTITIATHAGETRVYVRISDTGKGIPPEAISRIYDPGFTTQGGGIGTGLGLSIVYNIIQKHHGHIEVDSEVGKGTEFTVVLPIEQPL
jgi:signal transduction histidine kinase